MASVPIKIAEGDAMVMRRGRDRSSSSASSYEGRVPVPIAATSGSTSSPTSPVSVPTSPTSLMARPSTSSGPPSAPAKAASPSAAPTAAQAMAANGAEIQTPADASAVAATLPKDPSITHAQQVQKVAKEDPKVIAAEVEKTAAEERELLGEEKGGTIVEGVEDDELWTLLRRFDMQINHVLHPARDTPPKEPDLRMTTLPDVGFRSDTLRSNFERVFSVTGPNAVRGVRELIRLTDWENERTRTGIYCASYFIAWFFGYTALVVGLFIAVLICFPHTRRYLFPPPIPPPGAPPSATDPSNTAGDESLIGKTQGARHRSKAEQAEEQAFEARAVFEAYATTVMTGSKRGNDANSAPGPKRTTPHDPDADPYVHDEAGEVIGTRNTEEAPGGADAVVAGNKVEALDEKNKDKVAQMELKRKRDEMVGRMAKGTETGLGALADFVEILQNAVSPPAVYPDNKARFKLAAALVLGPALLFQVTPAWIWGRITTLSIGLALWARPLMIRAVHEFTTRVPNWRQLLDIRNSLLSGTPTNAQLTLHLLRVAEDLGEPLPAPPPPPLHGTPKEALKDKAPIGDGPVGDGEGAAAGAAQTKPARKAKKMLGGAFKKVSRKIAGFKGDVSVDNKGKRITSRFQEHLLDGKFGVESPDAYPCRLNGTAGHIILDTREARMAWLPLTSRVPDDDHIWDIDDIVELLKDNVSVPRMAFGWLGGAEVDSLGLTIRFSPPSGEVLTAADEKAREEEDKEKNTFHFERVDRRDTLFNRLIAMGPQRWDIL